MVTEAIFPSGRARAPTRGLPVSPTRSPLPVRRLRAPTTHTWSACLRTTPRVDLGQLRPPGVERQRTRASAQVPSPRVLPSEWDLRVPGATW